MFERNHAITVPKRTLVDNLFLRYQTGLHCVWGGERERQRHRNREKEEKEKKEVEVRPLHIIKIYRRNPLASMLPRKQKMQ